MRTIIDVCIKKTIFIITIVIIFSLSASCKRINNSQRFDSDDNILDNGKKRELFEGVILHRVYLLSGPDQINSQGLHLSGHNYDFDDYMHIAAGVLGVALGGLIIRDFLHVPKKIDADSPNYKYKKHRKTNRKKKSDILARSEIKEQKKLIPEIEKNKTAVTEQPKIIKEKTDKTAFVNNRILKKKTVVTPVSAEKFLKLADKDRSGAELEAVIGKDSLLYRHFDNAVEQDIVTIGLNRFKIKKIVSDENGVIEKVLVKKIKTNLIKKIKNSNPDLLRGTNQSSDIYFQREILSDFYDRTMKKIQAEYNENYVKKFSSDDKEDVTLKRLEYFNYTKKANNSNRWISKDGKWVKNELNSSPKIQKKALIIYPYSDRSNTAFDRIPDEVKSVFGGLMMNHDHVRFVRVKNIDELTKAVNEFTENGANKLDTMLMGGHGSSGSLKLDDDYSITMWDDVGWEKISQMKKNFKKDASIVLDSCNTGSLENVAKNIADKFAENLPGTKVYAPQKSVSANDYFFEKGSYQIAYHQEGKSIRYMSYKTDTDFDIPEQFTIRGNLKESAYFDFSEGTWKLTKKTSPASELNKLKEFRREHSYLYMSSHEAKIIEFTKNCCDPFGKGVNKINLAEEIKGFAPQIFKAVDIKPGSYLKMIKSSWFSSVERLDISTSKSIGIKWLSKIKKENTSLKNLNLHKIDFKYNATWDFRNYKNLNSLTITDPIFNEESFLIKFILPKSDVKINIPNDLRKHFEFTFP